ncbi:uncharacterized protein LOC131594831 [Vicia villosa]|uniref:uncharacterized protein LOC131594831 n=1 Tax=Vicia villosa TaxID=3911 RepID=UPI00273A7BDC|nr:uncharacterized protein LOC131594831 [Vicia villosa]
MFHRKSTFVQSSPATTAPTPSTVQTPSTAPALSPAPTPLPARAAPVLRTAPMSRATAMTRAAPLSKFSKRRSSPHLRPIEVQQEEEKSTPQATHELQRDVRRDELFLKTHKRKNGEWVDHRAEAKNNVSSSVR